MTENESMYWLRWAFLSLMMVCLAGHAEQAAASPSAEWTASMALVGFLLVFAATMLAGFMVMRRK